MKTSVRALLAENLVSARKRAGLSQAQLAEKSGLSQATISYMSRTDSSVKSPTLDKIEAVADALKMPVWELLIDHEAARRILLAQKIWATMAIQDEKLGDQWNATAVHETRATYEKPKRK